MRSPLLQISPDVAFDEKKIYRGANAITSHSYKPAEAGENSPITVLSSSESCRIVPHASLEKEKNSIPLDVELTTIKKEESSFNPALRHLQSESDDLFDQNPPILAIKTHQSKHHLPDHTHVKLNIPKLRKVNVEKRLIGVYEDKFSHQTTDNGNKSSHLSVS